MHISFCKKKCFNWLFFSFFACLLFLPLGCASTEEEPQPMDFMGLSGKRPEEAELAFAKARLLWHGQHRLHNTAPDECKNPQEAVALLTKAIDLSPEFDEALAYRALAFNDLGNHRAALNDINLAIRLNQTASYHAFRGLILINQSRFEEAQADVKKALSLEEKNALAWKYQGRIYQHTENSELACESFATACSHGDCSAIERARQDGYCPS